MNDRLKFRVWNDMQKCYSQDDHYIDEDGQLNTSGKYIVEQCTGLKDKNGKLIYEGDICIPAKDMVDIAGEIYRAESGAYFIKGKMKSGMEYDFGIYWHHYMYEVIGNIHENADLLENEE